MSQVIVLTPEQLDALVRKAVREEMAAALSPPEKPELTDEDLARARKSLRRFGRGT